MLLSPIDFNYYKHPIKSIFHGERLTIETEVFLIDRFKMFLQHFVLTPKQLARLMLFYNRQQQIAQRIQYLRLFSCSTETVQRPEPTTHAS